jgi:hypothetical protein
MVRNTVVLVSGAGVPEVNGEYQFVSIKFNAGYYGRRAMYAGKEARFTLYKCSLKNGGFQWFISITPDGSEPGSNMDIDFYYAQGKAHERLPPEYWMRMNPDPHRYSRDPAPALQFLRADHLLQQQGGASGAAAAAAAGAVRGAVGSRSGSGSGSGGGGGNAFHHTRVHGADSSSSESESGEDIAVAVADVDDGDDDDDEDDYEDDDRGRGGVDDSFATTSTEAARGDYYD